MRVRIVESFAEGCQVYTPGQELEVSDDRGVALLRLHVAERIESAPETATQQRGEKAVRIPRPVK